MLLWPTQVDIARPRSADLELTEWMVGVALGLTRTASPECFEQHTLASLALLSWTHHGVDVDGGSEWGTVRLNIKLPRELCFVQLA
jgi:hypothetical protein